MTVLRTHTLPSSIAGLGEVMQISLMASDFEGALRFWSEVVGAGPFFVIDHVVFDHVTYRDAPSPIDCAIAIGYWGDIQIEFAHQHNDAPSIFLPWQEEGREGLHHLGVLVGDLARARTVCLGAGATIVQEGAMPKGRGRFFYAQLDGLPPLIEVIEPHSSLLRRFAFMREAARNWDGSDPVRRVG